MGVGLFLAYLFKPNHTCAFADSYLALEQSNGNYTWIGEAAKCNAIQLFQKDS